MKGVHQLESRTEGVALVIKKCCVATEPDAAGVVFLSFQSENHPGFAISGCFAIFLDCSATPPCGECKEGTIYSSY